MEINEYQNNVYVVENGSIERMTYQNFLEEYCKDETTSPRGIENRLQVCSIIEDEDGSVIQKSINDRDNLEAGEDEILKWGVYSWGVLGRNGHLLSDRFDTEEEAYAEILRGFEYDLQNKSFNHPAIFDTEEEAQKFLAENMGVDIDVYKSIEAKRLYVTLSRKTNQAKHAAIVTKQRKDQFEEYKNIIRPVEGESYKETAARLSVALVTKIQGSVFHQIVKYVRM